MSVEQLKADLDQLNGHIDEFYRSLTPVLTTLDHYLWQFKALTQTTTRDLSALGAGVEKARDGFHTMADGLVHMSMAIDAFKIEL